MSPTDPPRHRLVPISTRQEPAGAPGALEGEPRRRYPGPDSQLFGLNMSTATFHSPFSFTHTTTYLNGVA